MLAPLIRAVPGLPLLAAIALAATGMLPALLGAAVPAAQVWGLRIAALLLGAGASFAMVDPMAPVTVTATPRWLRQWLRFTIVAVPAGLVWAGLCLLAVAAMPLDRPPLPVAGLAIEAAVCVLGGLTGAAVASRAGSSATTAPAGPAFQAALVVATFFLPGRWSPWALPGAATWTAVHLGWWAALPVLVAVLAAANREAR
ncbi:hypothetical protein Acy02nite_55660 [Actinoplanes cyaneus]|uniref:Uncharacterized protein n=1 Tax=Actinoplanes cyaneus TaxID=52696 RepID=A0A919M2W9_9ACTN|nr:hypothetical protein [Actinoplanes cyaneus]MCW2140015.1 hypothetical protein [Actinoplanes cyaneus]GID67685.1 hypothetical protein Acy02nite_55660 [Actinoplanes cyaneus]